MPTPTYTSIATVTLSTTDSEIVFSSIPATYKDFVLVGRLRTGYAALSEPLRIRFNGDSTTGNYNRVALFGDGTSASGYTDGPGEIIVDAGATAASATAATFSHIKLEMLDYSVNDRHKLGVTYSDVAAVQTRRQAVRWGSNSPINSISISAYFGGVFSVGSTLSLYGIAG